MINWWVWSNGSSPYSSTMCTHTHSQKPEHQEASSITETFHIMVGRIRQWEGLRRPMHPVHSHSTALYSVFSSLLQLLHQVTSLIVTLWYFFFVFIDCFLKYWLCSDWFFLLWNQYCWAIILLFLFAFVHNLSCWNGSFWTFSALNLNLYETNKWEGWRKNSAITNMTSGLLGQWEVVAQVKVRDHYLHKPQSENQ